MIMPNCRILDPRALQAHCLRLLLLLFLSLFFFTPVKAQEPLFETVGAPEFSRLPDFVSKAQPIRINRRALQASSMVIDIFGEQFVAQRDRVERRKPGQLVWVGHIQDNELDAVIITIDGNWVSGLIQRGDRMFRLGVGKDKGQKLFEVDVEALPPDDADTLPDGGGGTFETQDDYGTTAEDGIVQDLLVVYNQGACDKVGGCSQLEADIVTAVADINTAYASSGIMINMNLVGMARTAYNPSTSTQALYDLRGATDGYMDEIHPLRDQLGADLVSFVYNGPGCGIGYLKATASSAFTVVAVECLVGNRSMAHEIGHNQGAHHDRTTVGTTSTTTYNYGYRRCNDNSPENLGSPYFRTILSYPCTSSPRIGRFSNPGILYQGVPQGVDPKLDPERGAWNSRVLNESATAVSEFRMAKAVETVPAAPSSLQAAAESSETITLTWADNSGNETGFILQSSPDKAVWSNIATLPVDTRSFQHNGLLPQSTHYYRVSAYNSVGSSSYSNIAGVTTPELTAVEDLATGEQSVFGTVKNNYVKTHVNDGGYETIIEQSSGGAKKYVHTWVFDVLGGAGGVTCSVVGKVSGSEGADFYYSTDGGSTFHFMFQIGSRSKTLKSFGLPKGVSGTVLIQARDSKNVQAEKQDSLSVDYMAITSYAQAP